MNDTLQGRLYSQLQASPDRRALGFYDAAGRTSWRSYGDLYREASATSYWLAEHGLVRGEVCILVLPSDEFCANALLATLMLGAIPLLIAPPALQGQHSMAWSVLTGMIRKTKAKLVICSESLKGMRNELESGQPKARFLFGQPSVSTATVELTAPEIPAETDLAAYQLTSGTTGFPRVCVWRQRGVIAALDAMTAAMGLNQEDVCMNWTPLYHDMGLVNNYFLCLTSGVPLVMLSPQEFIREPSLWLRGLSDTGSTVTWSPNFGFAVAAQRIRDDELQGVSLSRVRAFWNAAERIHYRTMLDFQTRFASFELRKEALKTNFGCAENVGGATFSDPNSAFLVDWVSRSTLQERKVARNVPNSEGDPDAMAVVGVGRPCPGMNVKILARGGKELPDGHVGEVALDTPSRMEGYLSAARETRRALRGTLLMTGDLGYKRGQELFWVGRVRERITLRGRKLDPSDLESVLVEIAGLRKGCFAAFGVDDDKRGTQRLVVVSELRDSAGRSCEKISGEIRDRVFRTLGLAVDEVVLVRQGTLTKTSSGKRRHRHFRKLYIEDKLKPFQVPVLA